MSQKASTARKLLSLPTYHSFGFNNCTNDVYTSLPNIRKNSASCKCSLGKNYKMPRINELLCPKQVQR